MVKIPKGYAYTSRYSWTKAAAKKRAKKAREAGFNVRVISAPTKKTKRIGYVLVAKTTKKGYGWKKQK